MALTQTWVLQGGTPTTIGATDHIHFSDGTFLNPITVGAYNGGTHVMAADHTTDDSDGNTPKNSKYVAAGTVDIGAGTVDLTDATITAAASPLKITISYDSAITLSAVTFYAYDGTTPATGPVGAVVYAAEVDVDGAAGNDATWTELDGSGTALALNEATFLASATDHNAYILISASPESVGVKGDNKFAIAFTYQ